MFRNQKTASWLLLTTVTSRKVSGNGSEDLGSDCRRAAPSFFGYFASEFKDERVPTLAEVLEVCRGRVHLNIELKYYGHDQNLEQKVVGLVEEYGMVDDVVIMSLKLEASWSSATAAGVDGRPAHRCGSW
ncbi:MAG: glycerophosphodiester phosphodiesterase [Planctomycetaceae bacterium]